MEETLADSLLRGHESDLTVSFLGSRYPVWVIMERLLWIVDKNGDNIPFRLNRQQCRLYESVCEQKRAGEPMRHDVLKARQIGFSTFIAGLFFTLAMFGANVSVGIVADTVEHAQGIFEKYQHFYDCLDLSNPNRALIEEDPKRYGHLSWKPTLRYNKGQTMLATKAGNSQIRVMAVGDSAGRSKTYSLLHLSECAFWDRLGPTLRSLLQTVSRKNPDSMVFLETTANGFNAYKDRWDRDYSGAEGSYRAHFEPWWTNPDYAEDVPEGYDVMRRLEDWELERMRRYNLTERQMAWFHRTYASEADGDRAYALQEYPFSPVDAFVSSGSSVFDKEALAARKAELAEILAKDPPRKGRFLYSKRFSMDGSECEIGDMRFQESRNGPVAIFEEPDPSMPYVATCDPNMGGSDDVAIQVVNNFTGRQAARLVSNDMGADELAWQLHCMGRYYNWALVSSETNVGQIVMDLLIKAHYPKLYVTQAEAYENYRRQLRPAYGHKTTKANRQFMIDSLAMAFREDPSMIRDYDTICEMESFQIVERYDGQGNLTSSKQQAAGGKRDDLVMALAAFYHVRGQQSAVPLAAKPQGRAMGPDELEERVAANRRAIRDRVARKGSLW